METAIHFYHAAAVCEIVTEELGKATNLIYHEDEYKFAEAFGDNWIKK